MRLSSNYAEVYLAKSSLATLRTLLADKDYRFLVFSCFRVCGLRSV
jgi:hypothetical protein